MIVLQLLFTLLCLVLLVPALLFALQVGLAVLPLRRRTLYGDRPKIAVLMPAHNESAGIARPLNAIRAQLLPEDRLLVVADNCSDDTVAIARANGAEVIERHDTERRGKGYALDFGVRHLAASPPEVVIIVDADCLVHGRALDLLARRSMSARRPVQALYLMRSPRDAGLKTRIAEFAWTVKNWARPLGYHHLGLPCQLMGTGMAFPWRMLRDADLASGHIVEDLKLGLDLAAQRHAPVFCPQALVTSVFPANAEGVQSQRTRWEHGHLGMIFQEAPRQLGKALLGRNAALLSLALDLCIPPLALLVLLTLALCVAGALMWGYSGTAWPWSLALLDLLLVGAGVLLAWVRFGRAIISLLSLAYAPLYALGKLPIYLKFLVRRQVEWVRSRRD